MSRPPDSPSGSAQLLPNGLPRGRYRHYKGNDYEVLATATHSETGEALVVYRALYGAYGLWVRPLQMFVESVRTAEGGELPRFAWLGPASREKLAPSQWRAARAFLYTTARPLERAFFAWRYEGGSAEAVLVALAPYQNPDGGFGNALEPDLQMADSSVVATTMALHLLQKLGVGAELPLVLRALAWLRGVWDAQRERWPLIPGETDSAPHAPWWTWSPDHDEQFGGYLINPRLELLGYLWEWGAAQDRAWLEEMTERATEHLESIARPLSRNEAICCARFVGSPGAPAAARARVAAAVERVLPQSVAASTELWRSYALQPIEVAPWPNSPFAPALAPLLENNLNYLVGAQQTDGAWHPTWSWFGLYDEGWPVAESAWKGILTLEALEWLVAWGRVAH